MVCGPHRRRRLSLGLLFGWALSRAMEHTVLGIETTDSATFLGTAAILATPAVGTSLLPAGRASRTDPLETLRAE
jgi:ABC-type lipoprotein release transport system permease subunit